MGKNKAGRLDRAMKGVLKAGVRLDAARVAERAIDFLPANELVKAGLKFQAFKGVIAVVDQADAAISRSKRASGDKSE